MSKKEHDGPFIYFGLDRFPYKRVPELQYKKTIFTCML